MSAALIGYAAGIFFAAGGAGFIFLGLLRLIRVYKRWPRASYAASSGFVALLGVATAMPSTNTAETYVTLIAAGAAATFVAWKGKLFTSKPA